MSLHINHHDLSSRATLIIFYLDTLIIFCAFLSPNEQMMYSVQPNLWKVGHEMWRISMIDAEDNRSTIERLSQPWNETWLLEWTIGDHQGLSAPFHLAACQTTSLDPIAYSAGPWGKICTYKVIVLFFSFFLLCSQRLFECFLLFISIYISCAIGADRKPANYVHVDRHFSQSISDLDRSEIAPPECHVTACSRLVGPRRGTWAKVT